MPLKRQDIDIQQENLAYQGYSSIKQYQLRRKNFQDQWSQSFPLEIVHRPAASIVLPYDPIRQQVVLISQMRLGAYHDKNSPWIWECVAGIIEANETPQAAAERELQEEAGLTAKSLELVYEYWVSPGHSTEKFHFYYALVDASKSQGTYGVAAENEDILSQCFSIEESKNLVKQGPACNSMTLIALQWLWANYQNLNSRS
jgi:ADP-ribose pyrophosphatase